MAEYKPLAQGGDLYKKFEAKKLEQTIKKQKLKVAIMGGKVPPDPSKSPGFINRAFDLMSRANYAVANTALALTKKDGDISKVPSAFVKGLAGKEKTTFSKVIEQSYKQKGSKAPKWVKGVGGFIGDVLLDPTTYVGAGVVRAGGKLGGAGYKGIQKAGSVGEVAKAFNSPQLVKKADNVYQKSYVEAQEQIVKDIMEEGGVPAGTKGKELFKQVEKEADKIARVRASEFRIQEAKNVGDIAETLDESKIVLKYMGKPVYESAKAYEQFGKVFNALGANTKIGKGIREAFSLRALLPGRSRYLYSATKARNFAQYEESVNKLSSIVRQKGLTESDLKAATYAIEDGLVHELKNPAAREFAEESIALNKIMGTLEGDKNLIDKVEVARRGDRYIHHVYKNREKADDILRDKKVRAWGTENVGFSKKEKLPKLRVAKEAGLDPEENLLNIMAIRLHKHSELMARAEFMEEVGQHWGLKIPYGKGASKIDRETAKRLHARGYRNKHGSKVLGPDVWLPPEVLEVVNKVKTISSRTPESVALRNLFDKVQGQYKTLLTLPNPGFHMRNMLSDVWMAFMLGGVNSPIPFKQAAKVLYSEAHPGVKETIRIGDKALSATDVMAAYKRYGGRTGFTQTELQHIIKPRPEHALAGPQQFVKGLGETLRKGSEYREEFTRVAHFIDAWGKRVKKGMSFDEAAEDAMQQVQKVHVNYSALTPFEQNVMKRGALFYTWTSRNIFNMTELALTNPGRLSLLPKGKRAVQNLFLGETGENDIFPGMNEIVPEWIRELAPIKLRGEGEGNPLYWTFTTPFEELHRFIPLTKSDSFVPGVDTSKLLSEGLISNLTPLGRVPAELAFKKTAFSGAPISSIPEYLLQQTPQTRFISDAMKQSKGEKAPPLGIPGPFQNERWINTITGAGIRQVTPSAKKSELRRQQDPLQQIIRKLNKERGLVR